MSKSANFSTLKLSKSANFQTPKLSESANFSTLKLSESANFSRFPAPLRVVGKPSFLYPFALLKDFEYAPETGECEDA